MSATHTVTLAHADRSFTAPAGMPLLDAALAGGIVLEHSCRTGRCGSCRTQVVSGTTVAMREETGLARDDAANGYVLSCARAASSDVVIAAEDLSSLAAFAPRIHPCRIAALDRLADDVMQVTLRLPPSVRFAFRAGQYVDLTGPDGIRRSYSIANAPAQQGTLVLQIRKVEGGALSPYWFERAQVNDLLRLRGPLGTFVLRQLAGLDLVFLATGTGIAPVLSMLGELPELHMDERPRSVHVFWGGRRREDLYLEPLDAATPLLHVHQRSTLVLSRADTRWKGTRGHVQQAFLATEPDLSRTAVYACGSEAMVRDARHALTTAGLPASRFRSDAFVASH